MNEFVLVLQRAEILESKSPYSKPVGTLFLFYGVAHVDHWDAIPCLLAPYQQRNAHVVIVYQQIFKVVSAFT
jgi:hypothetical protein